jgi:DNA-binding CsgD family transcriptional regulator
VIILADPSEGVLGLALERGRPFGERDRELLSALQPHLRLAFRNARSFSAALETRGAQRGVAAAADAALERLSDRQRAVLALVAAGHSNAGIGAELGISAATVKKHLENIYARLEVSSRLAAARVYLDERGPESARSLEARLAPDPGDRLSPAGAR